MTTRQVVRSRVAAGTAGVLIGLSAVAYAYDLEDAILWVPDLATGLAFVILVVRTIPHSRPTAILAAAFALTWFAGTVLPVAVYWHRGVLIHLLLSYPDLTPRAWRFRAAIGVGYLASVTTYPWGSDAAGAAVAIVVLAAAADRYRVERRRNRAHPILPLAATAAFVGVVVAGSVARLVVANHTVAVAALVAYSIVLVGIAVAIGVRARPPDRSRVTDLVVELGEYPSSTVAGVLGRTVGDPSLEVGYWNPALGQYINGAGAPLEVPHGDDPRAAIPVDRDGDAFMLIVHDGASLGDPLLVGAIVAATRLSAVNSQLHAELRARVQAVAASRRRILSAADEERRRLQHTLQETVSAPLEQLARQFPADEPDETPTPLERARILLDQAMGELEEIGGGLHPRELDRGLKPALNALAERVPIPTSVAVTDRRFPREIEAAAYYTCAEALVNSEKHAGATAIEVRVVASATELTVVVGDDGVGGADALLGTGIRGLADRVGSVGGRLQVRSPPGNGTSIVAVIPLPGVGSQVN